MKALLMLSLFIMPQLHNAVLAQDYKWAGGIRTGVTDGINHNFIGGKDKLMWGNRIFVNRKVFKHFSIELSSGYYRSKNIESIFVIDTLGTWIPTDDIGTVKHVFHHIKTNFGLNYNMLHRNKLNLFAQGGITNLTSWSTTKVIKNMASTLGPEGHTKGDNSFISSVFIGLGANYNIDERLFLNALGNFEMNIDAANIKSDKRRLALFTPSLYIGLGYRF